MSLPPVPLNRQRNFVQGPLLTLTVVVSVYNACATLTWFASNCRGWRACTLQTDWSGYPGSVATNVVETIAYTCKLQARSIRIPLTCCASFSVVTLSQHHGYECEKICQVRIIKTICLLLSHARPFSKSSQRRRKRLMCRAHVRELVARRLGWRMCAADSWCLYQMMGQLQSNNLFARDIRRTWRIICLVREPAHLE